MMFFTRTATLLFVLVVLNAISPSRQVVASGECRPDFDTDGVIDAKDLQILAAHWRTTDPDARARYDLDGDGVVSITDLADATWYFGSSCDDLPSRTRNFYGVASNNLGKQYLDGQFQALGFDWIRTQVNWDKVEPVRSDPPTYKWDGVDGSLRSLAEASLRPLVIVSHNPSWAATTSCGPHDRLADETAFVQFVGALVERYDGDGDYNGDGVIDGPALPNVRDWEFWNEPDWNDMGDAQMGGCWGPQAGAYAAMLRAIYPVMHQANPTVRVVLGGLAAEDIGINPAINQPFFNFSRQPSAQATDFMTELLAAGAGSYFDVINFHYYRAFDRVWAGWGAPLLGKINWLNERLSYAGVAPKPIIVSEAGLRSDPAKVIDGVPMSQAEQARFVVQIHARGAAAGVDSMIWYTYSDPSTSEAWGLVDLAGQPKLSYASYARTVGFLRGGAVYGPGDWAGVESYRFRTAAGRPLVVAWAADRSVPAAVTIAARQLQVTRYDGQVTVLQDGHSGDEDGFANGQIRVTIDADPRFLETVQK